MGEPFVYRRRELVERGVGGAAAVSLGAAFWEELFGSTEAWALRPGRGYGQRRRPDRNGFRLPKGFRARLIARGGERVRATDYVWHVSSDGAATFPTRDGGWILVSNSETSRGGGASAIRFRRNGSIATAYRIVEGTRENCSGGGTPWGTWLSCEEVEDGRVWECDPAGRRPAVVRPAMGVFKHESAAVDRRGRRIYLSEDVADGGLYRFTPERWPDLSRGLLEIATVRRGAVRWRRVPDPSAASRPTRRQVRGSAEFARGEGLWLDRGVVYLATTGDHRVHAYDIRRRRIRVVYDGLSSPRAPLLRVDQLTVSRAGEVFVCEDPKAKEIDMGLITPRREVSRFLSVAGAEHEGSELTGVCFAPSGRRLYVASQRARGTGAVYEITGPFRRRRRSPK